MKTSCFVCFVWVRLGSYFLVVLISWFSPTTKTTKIKPSRNKSLLQQMSSCYAEFSNAVLSSHNYSYILRFHFDSIDFSPIDSLSVILVGLKSVANINHIAMLERKPHTMIFPGAVRMVQMECPSITLLTSNACKIVV